MATPTASTVTTTMTKQHLPPKQPLIPLKLLSALIDVQKEQEEKITMKSKLELEQKDAWMSELELELSLLSR